MGPPEPYPLVLRIDVAELGADIDTVDALARLALVARRHALAIRLDHVSAELREMIEFAGLTQVFEPAPLTPRSRLPRC